MFTTLLSLLLVLSHAKVASHSSCPADDPGPRAVAERFLTRSTFASVRDSLAVTGKGPADLRPLTDTADAAACHRLVEMFGPPSQNPAWRWSAYQIGRYYVVAFRRVRQTGTLNVVGWSPLYVLDTGFNPVHSELL